MKNVNNLEEIFSMQKKISTMHLVLIAAGGMMGSGWLFSPYYGLQVAGTGVLISWWITAALTLILALVFAEVASILPIVGGVMRFIGVTHSRVVGFLFVALAWISYIVYLPLEVQSSLQYLGFWAPSLINHSGESVSLSGLGVVVAFGVMALLTWFNTLHLSSVAKANSAISIWKLVIPVFIVIGVLLFFAKPANVVTHHIHNSFAFEPILLAVTSSGLAFAFAGFQNGLILANSAKNPKVAIPMSVIAPVVIGWVVYSGLSLMFMFCVPADGLGNIGGIAPLLGLMSLLGLHYIYVVLFLDAVVAPFGTANVYTTVTGKILLGFGKEFFPKSMITRLNKCSAPAVALWINFFLGALFLLPFPTWTQLVNFLSSLTLLSCLSGPIALMVFRRKFPDLERKFKLPFPYLFGYLGFASCTYFVYWSGHDNLLHLLILILIACTIYWLMFNFRNPIAAFSKSWYVTAYIASLFGVSYGRSIDAIAFPVDNYLVFGVSMIFATIFLLNQEPREVIAKNIEKLQLEVANDNK
mgnify:CR=1